MSVLLAHLTLALYVSSVLPLSHPLYFFLPGKSSLVYFPGFVNQYQLRIYLRPAIYDVAMTSVKSGTPLIMGLLLQPYFCTSSVHN